VANATHQREGVAHQGCKEDGHQTPRLWNRIILQEIKTVPKAPVKKTGSQFFVWKKKGKITIYILTQMIIHDTLWLFVT